MIWNSSDYSHPGHSRKINEDAVFSDPRSGTWCVADGMGGHEQGGLASLLLVETIADAPIYGSLEQRVKEIQQRILRLNQALYAKGRDVISDHNGKRQIIGCTFVILISDGLYSTCLWAGDSRLYLLREDNLYQITDDHTVVNDLLARGVISKSDSENHPQSHIVTRALGAAEHVEFEKKTFAAREGDRYLLCSDGLYNELDSNDISEALSIEGSSNSCRVLIEKVLQTDATDNLTGCVINASYAPEY